MILSLVNEGAKDERKGEPPLPRRPDRNRSQVKALAVDQPICSNSMNASTIAVVRKSAQLETGGGIVPRLLLERTREASFRA
jgi:hypothetical protein